MSSTLPIGTDCDFAWTPLDKDDNAVLGAAVSGQLLDSKGVAVGDEIQFSEDSPGVYACRIPSTLELVKGGRYFFEIVTVSPDESTSTVRAEFTAGYLAPEVVQI